MKKAAIIMLAIVAFAGCKKENDPIVPVPPTVTMKFVFDENQERLDNFGEPVDIPAGNAGQAPQFNQIAAHYVELIPNENTPLGGGVILYQSPETTAGGDEAISFDQLPLLTENEVFDLGLLADVPEGTYRYIRVSLAYQNYTLDYLASGFDLTGTLASFIGYNTYITEYTMEDQAIAVNGNKLQGYWGFETVGSVVTGQTPPGATTVPNPISSTSPIPAGSCLVTGAFDTPIVIDYNNPEDLELTISLSINDSFEWQEVVQDGKWEPGINESVVDMGIRGLIGYSNQ